jgi:ribosomal protein S18 acetylase RimI-like enzyme
MPHFKPQIRPATAEDALHVACIVEMAGHAIDNELWTANAGKDHSMLAGARRLVLNNRSLPYHYSKAWIAELDGAVAGGFVGYVVEETEPPQRNPPDYLRPLILLENQALGYWSLIAIAVYDEYRGKGLATIMLDEAEVLARRTAAKGLSLVVESDNEPAVLLYQKLGFSEAARLPWLPFGGRSGSRDWLMMTRDFIND